MNKSIYPKARKSDLITSKMDDETIVYDTEANKASCLNELTTVVWEVCDGKRDTTEILAAIRNAGHQDATDQVILMAIDQLDRAGLLEESVDIDERSRKSLNRRKMLRLLGVAAALPVVSTIDIQPAIAALSSLYPNEHPCTSSSQCLSDNCCSKAPKAEGGQNLSPPLCLDTCHQGNHRLT